MELTETQRAILRYMRDGGHMTYSDGRFNWKPDALPPFIDRREIEALEESGLITFKDGFSSSIGSLSAAGLAAAADSTTPPRS